MRRLLAFAAIPLLAGCASAAGRPEAIGISREVPRSTPAIALRNAGFESPPRSPNACADRWDCSAHADPGSYSFRVEGNQPPEGAQSMCIERVGLEPWATVTQAILESAPLRGATLRLSMMLKLDGTTGEGAGPWVVLHGSGGRMLKHDQKLLKSTSGWQRVALDIEVLPTTDIVEIGATLEGPGRACLDDVRLEVLKAGRGPV